MDYFAHPTAIVADGAVVGEDTRIWHWTHVRDGARIGARCTLGQNVYVAPSAVVGDGVKIQNNVSVFDGVILENGVFCGPSAVFTNVSTPRSYVDRSDQFQTTLVKKGATVGANATVVCGVVLGRYSFVGAGSVVTDDVADHALVVGNPAHRVGWSCRCGARLPTPEPESDCRACGDRYRLGDGELNLLSSSSPA